MRKKYGKFYADWRDAAGARHMKACRTRQAALKLSAAMRKEASAKKAAAQRRSRRSSTAGPKRNQKTTSRRPRRESLRISAVISPRAS